jgi:hypothetical protein
MLYAFVFDKSFDGINLHPISWFPGFLIKSVAVNINLVLIFISVNLCALSIRACG